MSTPIPCDDPECKLPVARVLNGALVIESRHHGKVHRGTISLHALENLLTTCNNSVILHTGDVKQVRTPP